MHEKAAEVGVLVLTKEEEVPARIIGGTVTSFRLAPGAFVRGAGGLSTGLKITDKSKS